jgi:putative exporter of polyketide antibiotics
MPMEAKASDNAQQSICSDAALIIMGAVTFRRRDLRC